MSILSWINNLFKKQNNSKNSGGSKKSTASSNKSNRVYNNYNPTKVYTPQNKPNLKPVNAPLSSKQIASKQQYNQQQIQSPGIAAKPIGQSVSVTPVAPAQAAPVPKAKLQDTPNSLLKGKTNVTQPKLIQDTDLTQTTGNPFIMQNLVGTPQAAKAIDKVKEFHAKVEKKKLVDDNDMFSMEYRQQVQKEYDKAQKDSQYAVQSAYTKPNTLDDLKLSANEKKDVTTITSEQLDDIQRAQENGRLQVVYLRNDKNYVCTTKTGWGAEEISSHYLNGIKDTDEIVLFDSVTNRFYRYDTNSKKSQQTQDYMNAVAYEQQHLYDQLENKSYNSLKEAQSYADQLNELADIIEAGTATQAEYDKFNEAYAQYNNLTNTKEYTALAANYNATFTKLQKLQGQYDSAKAEFQKYGLSDIVMNRDWKNAVHANVDKVNKARAEYEEMRQYYSDPKDDKQMNSVSDAIRKFVGATSFNDTHEFRPLVDLEVKDIKTLGKDLVAQFKQTWVKPISFLINHWDTDDKLVLADYNKRMEQYRLANPKMSAKQLEKEFGTRANLDARLSQQFKVIKQAGGMLLTNTLTNLGETFDMFNVLKPGMVASQIYGKEDLINEAGLQKYYEQALNAPDEILKQQLAPIDNTLSEEEKENKARADVMANVMTKAYWGAYDSATPQFEYEMLWLDEDEGFISFAAQMALDLFLDPSFYVGLAPLKMSKAGSMIDDVSDRMTDIVKRTDFGDELSEREIKRAAKHAVNDAILQDMPIEDTINKNLAKQLMNAAQSGGKMKYIMKDLPDTEWVSVLKNRADDVHLFMSRMSELGDSQAAAAKAIRSKQVGTAIKAVLATGNDTAKALGDSYKMIGKMTHIKKSLDFIDEIAFNMILPVKPVQKIAQGIKYIIQADPEMMNTANYLSTMVGRLKAKLGEKPASVVNMDEAMKTVEREVHTLTSAELLSRNVGDELLGTAHKAIINDTIDTELDEIYYSLFSNPSITDLTKKFNAISPDINNLQDYFNMLKQPIGRTNKKLYSVLDNSNITKLRRIQRQYNKYQTTSVVRKADEIIKPLQEWNSMLNTYKQSLRETVQYNGDIAGKYDALVKSFDNARSLYIEGTSKITKDQLNDVIMNAQQAITKATDNLPTSVVDLDNVLKPIEEAQAVFKAYTSDIRDSIASSAQYKVNKEVELKYFNTHPAIPANQQATTNEVVQGFKKAFKDKYDIDLTKQQLSDVFYKNVKDLPADVDLSKELRVYTGMLTKSNRAIEYASNTDLNNVVDAFLSNNSPYTHLVDTLDYTIAKPYRNILSEAATFKATSNIFKDVSLSDIKPIYTSGIVDALSGEQHYVNSIFKNMDVWDATSVNRGVDSITNHIIQTAASYTAHTTEVDVKQFAQLKNGVRRNMNSLNTERNVQALQDVLDATKSAKTYLAEESNKYYDVLYSISKTNDYGDPYMITLKYGDTTVTLKNKDIIYNPLPDYPTANHGMSAAAAQAEFAALNIQNGLHKLDFDRAVSDTLGKIKQAATESEDGAKSIRFIGYNNGIMGTNQDRALNKYIRENAISVHNDMTVDVADFIRVDKGIPVYDTVTKDTLKDIIARNVDLAQQYNTQELLTTFDGTLFSSAHNLNMDINVHQFKDSTGVVYPDNFIEAASNMLSNLDDATRALNNKTSGMAKGFEDVLVREKVLLDIVKEYKPESDLVGIDVPSLLRDAMKLENKNITFNVEKLIDGKLNEYLFDQPSLQKYLKVDTAKHIRQLKSFSDELYNTIKRIRQPELINSIDTPTYKNLQMIMLSEAKASQLAELDETIKLLDRLNTKNSEVMYAGTLWLFNKLKRVDETNTFTYFISNAVSKSDELDSLFKLVNNADGLIFNTKTASFTLNDRTYYSKLFGTADNMSLRLDDVNTFKEYISTANSLTSYVAMQDSLDNAGNIISAADSIANQRFKDIIQPYLDFLNNTVGINVTQPSTMTMDTLKDTYDRASRIQKVKSGMTDMAQAHRHAAMQTVFNLSDEDFFVYLVRDCKNTLYIDLNSTMMKNKELRSTVLNRLESLKESPMFTIKYADDNIKVYHDLSNLNNKNADRFYQSLKDYHVDYSGMHDNLTNWTQYMSDLHAASTDTAGPIDIVKGPYNTMYRKLSESLPENWAISTFNVNTQDTAKGLQELFPESSRLNLDDLNAYGFFDDSFTCSVWADPDKIIADNLIQYYTPDLIKSMGNGMYQVRNNLEAVKNKFALYNNNTQSLKYLVDSTGIKFKDYKDLNRQLNYNGLVLSKGIVKDNGMYKVKKVQIKDSIDFKRAMNDTSVIFMPNDVYSEMVQFSKGHNLTVKYNAMDANSLRMHEAFKWWNQKIRSARMTMYLFSNPATGIRNYIDSPMKGYLTTGDPEFFKYMINAPELLNKYEDVYAKAVGYYNTGSIDSIIKLFKEHPDETAGLTLDQVRLIMAHRTSASAGGMLSSLMGLKVQGNFNKLQELLKNYSVSDETIHKAMRVYQEQYNKEAHKISKSTVASKALVHDALKKEGITGEVLDILSDAFYGYTPTSATFTDWVRKIPGIMYYLGQAPKPDVTDVDKLTKGKSLISNYITMNSNLFSAAEDNTRLALFMYYADRGYSPSAANKKIIQSQFDYSARPAWMDKLEIAAPFSTFKMYNAAYWMTEAPQHFNVIRQMTKLTRNTGVGYDTEEIMNLVRGIIIRDKLASGEIAMNSIGDVDAEESTDGIWSSLAQTIMGEEGVIATYEGQPGMYAELAGGIPLGRHHVLKVGNTFVEGFALMNDLLLAIPQLVHGEVPDIIKDSVYSPIQTVLGLFKTMVTSNFNPEAIKKWVTANYYDVMDFIPFLGALANLAVNHMKNGRVNMQDLFAIAINPELTKEYLNTITEQFFDITGTILPGLIGTIYNKSFYDRPIGTDWYAQSDNYKATHRYVFGVSYIPTFFSKDPRTYVDYSAMFMRMGYTAEEARAIISALAGNDMNNAPDNWWYNPDTFDMLLQHMLDRGYSMTEALHVMMNKDLWNGDDLWLVNQEKQLNDSVFFTIYDRLPDYVKYTDGQFTELRKYYRSQGLNEAQIWAKLLYENGFIDVFGNYKQLAPETVTSIQDRLAASYSEFYTGLPEWFRYEDGAATRTVKDLIKRMGFSTQQARNYILDHNYYVDIHGQPHYLSDEESAVLTAKNKEDFYTYYGNLPDFMKYEKGAYGRTLSFLVNIKGITEAEAKQMMVNGAYLTLDGILIDCRGLKRTRQYNQYASNRYKKWKHWYTRRRYVKRKPRPRRHYMRRARINHQYNRKPYNQRWNSSKTYSLVNVLHGRNFGSRNAYKVTLGYNTVSSALSTKGNYPASWRNIRNAYRKNMYRDMYAKYGASRMAMRSNAWHSYSNASITRLRRGEIYADRKYKNRRTF